jgi:hypothetical protein
MCHRAQLASQSISSAADWKDRKRALRRRVLGKYITELQKGLVCKIWGTNMVFQVKIRIAIINHDPI